MSAMDAASVTDLVTYGLSKNRGLEVDGISIKGWLEWVLRDETTGKVKASGVVENLITAMGQQYYAERANGITTLGLATGMRLGTGTTAAALTGAGAAIVTYVSGSSAAFASGPTSSANGNARNIVWTATWAAGTGTATAIAEVVVTNESGPTNVAGTAANTIARALFGATFDKTASDSLTVTYTHTIGTV